MEQSTNDKLDEIIGLLKILIIKLSIDEDFNEALSIDVDFNKEDYVKKWEKVFKTENQENFNEFIKWFL
jgi:hypothetical protein